MTLQMALIGRDGIVLAGDKKIRTTDEYFTTSLVSKVKLDRERRIAVSWAVDDIGETIASAITGNPNVLSEEHNLEQFIKTTYRSARRNRSDPLNKNPRCELLAVSRENLKQIVFMPIDKARNTPQLIKNKAFAGDVKNPACYFVEKYYDTGLSVTQLISLAAHTILAAGNLNPLGIEELEIFTCTERAIETVPDSEIMLLAQQTKQIDEEIRRLLLSRD